MSRSLKNEIDSCEHSSFYVSSSLKNETDAYEHSSHSMSNSLKNEIDAYEQSSHSMSSSFKTEMDLPSRVARFVTRNISPFADRSCSSGLNGSDLEQMSYN